MSNGWTQARRERQAAAIHGWQPWSKSTGPRTEAGKARSSRNADKGGQWKIKRDQMSKLRRELRALRKG